MKRITLKSEYFEENKCDEYIDLIDEVICDEIRYGIDYDLYRGESINIIDNGGLTVDIEKIYDYGARDVLYHMTLISNMVFYYHYVLG